MVSAPRSSVLIIGAGPAGLTAAYESLKKNVHPILIEKSGLVGGIARTELYKGFRFDIGGHRFFTHFEEIQRLWEEVLQKDFIKVPRISRIYYKKRFYKYPLSLFNTISNLGALEGLLILFSYIRAKLRPHSREDTFEEWVTHRFGRRLYRTFFKTYTEKVWGIPCSEIRSDWAAQRIKGLSLRSVIYDALVRSSQNGTKTLIREFHYPVFGPGMMWESMQKRIEEQGGEVFLKTEAIRLQRSENRIGTVSAKREGKEISLSGESIISSMPLVDLIHLMDPPPPDEVLKAADRLRYRDFILVGLILNKPGIFPDNWIYVHSPEVKVGRIQNFINWSSAMVAHQGKTSLGMEYFCYEGDALWSTPDAELIQLAKEELQKLKLAPATSVEDGIVFRQPKAYPVYNNDYRENTDIIRRFLGTIDNLQTIGRNGLHRYNNQDHSMLTAIMAVGNLLGQSNDIWAANTEPSYYE
ncbi:MAG: NAD(P)/FAD-dependent oxidoreductase [Acidobacteria bacterium]|nr:NAD(P)/FAD-dependent oxidoreductase [Acidobacteriota bacterium]